MAVRPPFEIGMHTVLSGSRRTVDLPVSVLSDHTPVSMSVHVAHGSEPGPTVFVSAAVHGDEVIGVEIVRRLLRTPSLDKLKGTLLAIPIVNAFGFLNQSRYLPDRRDLNRSFPGNTSGSLAARLAHLFVTEIVARSDLGIDLHSAAIHRTNLPQIRVSPKTPNALTLADIFGAPVVMTAPIREGSMREAARGMGVEILVYEAGEGLRFDELAVRAGVTGILRVLNSLGMVPSRGIAKSKATPIRGTASAWIRAPAGGLLRTFKSVGETVTAGDLMGVVSDPFGENETEILAARSGIIIGRINLPIVNEGDALFHVAEIAHDDDDALATLESFTAQLEADPLFDEDEII